MKTKVSYSIEYLVNDCSKTMNDDSPEWWDGVTSKRYLNEAIERATEFAKLRKCRTRITEVITTRTIKFEINGKEL